MPGRILGGSKLNFAGDFSTRSHCSLQISVSSYLSMYLGQWAVFRRGGMTVLGEEKTLQTWQIGHYLLVISRVLL